MDEPFRHTRTVSKAHTHTQIHKHTNTHKHTHTGGDSNLEFPNGQAFQTNEHTAKLFPQQLEHTKLALRTVHSGLYIEKQRCSILGRVGLLWAGWLRMVPPHPSYWIVPPPNHHPPICEPPNMRILCQILNACVPNSANCKIMFPIYPCCNFMNTAQEV